MKQALLAAMVLAGTAAAALAAATPEHGASFDGSALVAVAAERAAQDQAPILVAGKRGP